jgi:hypothetical protein
MKGTLTVPICIFGIDLMGASLAVAEYTGPELTNSLYFFFLSKNRLGIGEDAAMDLNATVEASDLWIALKVSFYIMNKPLGSIRMHISIGFAGFFKWIARA